MANYNPYAIDPALAQGISNLTAALVGSTQDDLNLARVRQADAAAEASRASAGAAGALAAQRAEQTRRLKELGGIASGLNPALASSIAKSLGLDVTIDTQGNIIQNVAPNGPQMSVPVQTAEGDLMTLDNSGIQSLSNAFFGDLSYRPDQFAAGLDTLGGAGNSRLAESMILGGTPDQAQRGALMLQPGGGQYQNPNFAMEQLNSGAAVDRYVADQNLAGVQYTADQNRAADQDVATIGANANIDIAEINAETTIEVAKLDNTSREAIAAGDRDAQTGWENYRTDAQTRAELAVEASKDAREREIASQENARLTSNDINDQYILNDGVLITSPELGQRLGLQQITIGTGDQAQTVYGHDGRVTAQTSKMPVILEGLQNGGEPVVIYVDPKDLENSNAVNRNGQFVVPDGSPLYKPAASTTTTREFGTAEQNQVAAAIGQTMDVTGYDDVPDAVRVAVTSELMTTGAEQFQATNNIQAATSAATAKLNETFRGQRVFVATSGFNVAAPGYVMNYMDEYLRSDQARNSQDGGVGQAASILVDRYGYTENEAIKLIRAIQ